MIKNIKEREIFAKNLQYYMIKKNKSQADLVRDLHFNKSTVSAWLTSKIYPRIDKIQDLADYFGIYKSDLTEDKELIQNAYRSIKIPVLKQLTMGHAIDAVENIIDYEEIEFALSQTGIFFGYQLSTDTNESKFPSREVVIVKQQSTIETGQIALVCASGKDATINKIIKNEAGIILTPFNTSCDPIFYSNEDIESKPVEIAGRVIELRAKF